MKLNINFLAVLVSFILLVSCSKTEKEESDLEKMKLNGKVKSLREFSYEAVEKFGELSRGKRKREYSWKKDKHYIFNRKGYKIELTNFESDGSLYNKTKWKYNDEVNIIEKVKYQQDGSIDTKETHKYNNEGKQTEFKNFNSKGNMVGIFSIEYNTDTAILVKGVKYNKDGSVYIKISGYSKESDNGRMLGETYIYNSDGSLKEKEASIYDNKDNPLEVKTFNPDGSLLKKEAYKYNDGNKTKYSYYKSDGSINYELTYKYDNKNNLIEKIKFNSNGDIVEKQLYKLKYDNKDNWVYKLLYENDIPKYIFERQFEYFD